MCFLRPSGAADRGDRAGGVAQREKFPVRLSAAASVTYRIAGWLCADGSPQGHTVEVLIPGLTYGAWYWNFPVDPARYSYMRAATAGGYATLAIDRLGTGASDRPPAAQLTAMSEAFALHDVVGQLRAGKVGDVSFGKIVLVGHSYGSDIPSARRPPTRTSPVSSPRAG